MKIGRSAAVLAWVSSPVLVVPMIIAACGSDSETTAAVDASAADATADRMQVAPDAPIDTDDASVRADAQVDSGRDAGTDASADASDAGTACTLGDGGSGLLCSGTCVDVTSDPQHCGSCEVACQPGSLCSGGCVDVAGSLSGLRWTLPCTANGPQAEVCITNPTQTQTATLNGTTGKVYDVTLHLRGVVEQKTYNGSAAPDGGLADGGVNPTFFVVGGAPNADDWNVYQLAVSAPPYTAYLNNGASNHFYTDALDYTVTVQMKAGATVTLTANPSDNGPYEIRNRNQFDGGAIVIPDAAPAPDALSGQFVQMDVVGVTVAP